MRKGLRAAGVKVVSLITFSMLFTTGLQAQDSEIPKDFLVVDTAIFQDAAHHWYDIPDKGNIINPPKNKARFKATQLTEIADNILLYQKENGGWPKNYDMLAILSPSQKDSLLRTKSETNTTFDNRNIYSQIACLAKIYYVTKQEKYKESALKGLDFIIISQYSNGGWPQYFPLKKNYSRYITYNDDVFSGIMHLLLEIKKNKVQYNFIDAERKEQLLDAFDKGVDCILKTQIRDGEKTTVWCQQHDEKTLEPVWARAFEPACISNAESVNIVLLLMSIENPDKRIIEAVQSAVNWFDESKITNTRIKTIKAATDANQPNSSKTDRVVIEESDAPPIWTRYYELKTYRPMFCDRDRKIVYSLAEVGSERRGGYAWYTYGPQKVLKRFPAWQQKWATDKKVPELKSRKGGKK